MEKVPIGYKAKHRPEVMMMGYGHNAYVEIVVLSKGVISIKWNFRIFFFLFYTFSQLRLSPVGGRSKLPRQGRQKQDFKGSRRPLYYFLKYSTASFFFIESAKSVDTFARSFESCSMSKNGKMLS